MINDYIKADIWRITRRIPRAVMILISYAIFVYYIVKRSQGDSWNSVFFMEAYLGGLVLLAYFCSVIEFISVFSEDLKAKTMQVAIGCGMKRRHVILTKWIDCMLLVLIDYLLACIIGLITGFATGVHINLEQFGDLAVSFLGDMLSVGGYYSLVMIVVFWMQSILIPLIVYVCLCFQIIESILKTLFSIEALQPLNLEKFLIATDTELFKARLMIGSFDVKAFIIILIYIAAGYLISNILFKKKELEF